MAKTYFQPEYYYDDGINIDYLLPPELDSSDVFGSMDDCKAWLYENGYDPDDFVIREYECDDIEKPTIAEVL